MWGSGVRNVGWNKTCHLDNIVLGGSASEYDFSFWVTELA